MKPIALSIAGLHSFRQKQTIDFETLCSGGVFGIFGPTGSGKSSILDAMTLALYGKVERAANNTQGILNHAENELKVSFTFELKNAENKQRYIVERTFKRSDDIRVKSTTSRLMEVGEETVVLADKTNEVNQAVQELLGLTIDDFTRAVVLPQGKFAEFLSLKGAERRQMLQRLFNLEQYGDQLNQKIRSQLYKVKSDLDQVVAEQAGLGDASKEKVEEAEEQLRSSILLLEKREKELAEVDKVYEQQRQHWEWQQEKEQLQENLVVLKKEEQEIQRKEKAIQEGEQAEKLKPYLEGYEQAVQQLNTYKKRATELEQHLQQLKVEYQKAKDEYEIARQNKREEEPALLNKKLELQQAAELEKNVKLLTTENEQLRANRDVVQTKLEEKRVQVNNEQSQYEKWSTIQQQFKEKLKAIAVTATYRDLVDRAYYDKKAIVQRDTMLKEETERLEKDKKETIQLQESLKQSTKKQEMLQEQAQQSFTQVERLYHVVCEREVEFDYVFATCEALLKQVKKEADDERAKQLAMQLAKQLHDGEACPVCGSLSHPNPIHQGHLHEQESKTVQINQLENLTKELREQKYRYASLKENLERIAHEINNSLARKVDILYETHKVVEPLEEIVSVEGLSRYVQRLTVELKSLHQDYIEVSEAQNRLNHQRQLSIQEVERVNAQLKQLEISMKEKQQSVTDYSCELQELNDKWNDNYEQVDYEKIEQIKEELSERSRQEQELRHRIEKSVKVLEDQHALIQQTSNEVTEFDRTFTEIKTNLRNKEEALKEKQEALTKIIGSRGLSALMDETNRKLEELTNNEDEAYKTWQHTQEAYQKAQSEQQAVEQALHESNQRFVEIEAKWNQLLSRSLFKTISEVNAAYVPEEEMRHLKATIEQFWDKIKQVEADIRKLEGQLQNQLITNEQWEETKQLRVTIQHGVKEAGEIKGAASQTVQDVKERHIRFVHLEKEKTKHERLYEQYQKLQSVFKGNTFVEYMAEEQLMTVSRDASSRLATLTRQRYAIEVDSQGGFIMRDDANGGVKRPVSTLSGGETFLTSLALALSLSAQIQLRGQYPLQFFFLDEGFGTLDSELLDTVITALEKLQSNNLSIGVISHVQELRARLPKRLIVEPSEPSGKGTTVSVESL
ncbi:SMC family ATPase [Bacillus sp. CGMCC 1.16541]|uniref:SbcC/MukB-like Walker B domain-containing protein n=1 Tax=Bacillus sp. CGMCC 1.16541 TaxID=2185143 RepID=UPI000D73176F|nr:SMC family ATPase [Bacillus sp. CGMCC 1.16541]